LTFPLESFCKIITHQTGLYIIFRAKFSEITARSVQRALQTLAEPNKNINDAVEVRQELDLRIGKTLLLILLLLILTPLHFWFGMFLANKHTGGMNMKAKMIQNINGTDSVEVTLTVKLGRKIV
jgi:flagellar motor switch/type III secretory pathway protein FliN